MSRREWRPRPTPSQGWQLKIFGRSPGARYWGSSEDRAGAPPRGRASRIVRCAGRRQRAAERTLRGRDRSATLVPASDRAIPPHGETRRPLWTTQVDPAGENTGDANTDPGTTAVALSRRECSWRLAQAHQPGIAAGHHALREEPKGPVSARHVRQQDPPSEGRGAQGSGKRERERLGRSERHNAEARQEHGRARDPRKGAPTAAQRRQPLDESERLPLTCSHAGSLITCYGERRSARTCSRVARALTGCAHVAHARAHSAEAPSVAHLRRPCVPGCRPQCLTRLVQRRARRRAGHRARQHAATLTVSGWCQVQGGRSRSRCPSWARHRLHPRPDKAVAVDNRPIPPVRSPQRRRQLRPRRGLRPSFVEAAVELSDDE